MVRRGRKRCSKSKGKSCSGRRKSQASKMPYRMTTADIPTPISNTLASYGWGMKIRDDHRSSGLYPLPRTSLKTTMPSYSPRLNGIY